MTMHMLAHKLSERLGQQFIVDNSREVNVALRDPELQRKARLFGLDAPRHHAGGDGPAHARRNRQVGGGDRKSGLAEAVSRVKT